MDYLLFLLFLPFFFVAMTLFLGVGVELRQGFKLRVDRVLITLGPRPLTDWKNGTVRVPAATKKHK